MADQKKRGSAPAKAVTAVKKDDTKPGFFQRIGRWFREMKSELKKVQWPTRKQTINNTLIVIACVIVVGIFMMSNVLKMKFEGDMADVLGGFVAIIMMPFTYSIANGIMFGMLTWVILKVCKGKFKEIHPIMWVVFALFALRIFTLVM